MLHDSGRRVTTSRPLLLFGRALATEEAGHASSVPEVDSLLPAADRGGRDLGTRNAPRFVSPRCTRDWSLRSASRFAGGCAAMGFSPLLARVGGSLVDLAPPPLLLLTLIGVLLVTAVWSAFLRRRYRREGDAASTGTGRARAGRAGAARVRREVPRRRRERQRSGRRRPGGPACVREPSGVRRARIPAVRAGGDGLHGLIHPDDRAEALARHRKRLLGEPVQDPHQVRMVTCRGAHSGWS